jgi:sugar phosphate isomerase/epimerase
VRRRAAKEMIKTAKAARLLGVEVVNGFTGSSIWPLLYAFPPVSPAMIDAGYQDFGKRWKPILDGFQQAGVKFALEVHPTEIAFDIASAERALEAVDGHPAFGFNYDPSHLGYQGVDYVAFIERFRDRIFHVHMKDVAWRQTPGPSGVFGGHLTFGDVRRFWDFRSLGRGNVDFERILRALNAAGYHGPLSVEWEDSGMDREHGAREACAFVKRLDFAPSAVAFDAAFEKK